MTRMWFVAVLMALALPLCAQQRQITVAAASDLTAPLKEIARTFEKTTQTKVNLVFGSSGNLFAQIQNGAPYDVFLSADSEYPRKLVAAGKAVTPIEYASGKIVLWVRFDSPFAKNLSIEVLRSPQIKRVAIANPQHAPYGRAAMSAFETLKLKSEIEPKLVLGENVAQTAQFVLSGNADAGVIALSLALSSPLKDRGTYVQFPANSYPRLTQTAVRITNGKSQPEEAIARRFESYLRSPESQEILKRYGFEVPQATNKELGPELKPH